MAFDSVSDVSPASRHWSAIRVYYAMINKSQGQSLNEVGLYLRNPVFSHRQLHVALSRATSSARLKIVIEDDKQNYTRVHILSLQRNGCIFSMLSSYDVY
jgi:hypothetical protein